MNVTKALPSKDQKGRPNLIGGGFSFSPSKPAPKKTKPLPPLPVTKTIPVVPANTTQIPSKSVHFEQIRASLLQRAEATASTDLRKLPDEEVTALLHGSDVTIQDEKRVVRVFTSSTFTDTKVERNFLMVNAFPFLQQLCRILGLEFQVVDMRWGVQDDTSDNHGTSSLCMKEVKKCLDMSLSTAFVTILGQKYGYRPFPTQIEVAEFEQLFHYLQFLQHPDLALLEEWYDKDMNNVPPKYTLKPIPEVLVDYRIKGVPQSKGKDYDKWWPIFEKIQAMLQSAAIAVLDPIDAHKYVRSVTEEEVINGILANPFAETNTLFFDREYTNVDLTVSEASRFVDIKASKEDTDATSLLKKLKKEVIAFIPKNVCRFDVEWKDRTSVPEDILLSMAESFCCRVAESTLEQYVKHRVAKDSLIEEVLHHRKTKIAKCESFVVRQELYAIMQEYIHSHARRAPLIVHGESGSGKTCFMAQFAAEAKKIHAEAVVVVRFIGTSPQSSDGRSLLYSVACQLARIYESEESDVPTDYDTLSQLKCLELATRERPLFLFLDSLDQLIPGDQALGVQWVPDKLSPNVHLVLSTLPNVGGCYNALRARFAQDNFLEVTPLNALDATNILDSLLASNNRKLTPSQHQQVEVCIAACPLPLYIRLITELSSQWRSSQPVPPNLPTTIQGLIHAKLSLLEQDHGKPLVSRALGYITAAKNGLTMNELEDVLACDDDVLRFVYAWWEPPIRRLPPSLWVRIQHDLGTYLVERGSDNYIVYSWYHRQWREVITARYLSDIKEVETIHSNLADYFGAKWVGRDKPYFVKQQQYVANRFVNPQPLYISNNVPNIRKLSELPYHQLHCGRFAEVANTTLGELSFISAKIEANKLFELMEDFLLADKISEGKTELGIAEVQEYYRFVGSNLHILVKDQAALYQLALCHPNNSVIYKEAVQRIKEHRPNQMFSQWLNKSAYPDPCYLTLSCPQSYIELSTVLIYEDGEKVVAVVGDVGTGKIYTWNCHNGAIMSSINVPFDIIQAEFLLSHDANSLFCFGPEGIAHTFNLAIGSMSNSTRNSNYKTVPNSACFDYNSKRFALVFPSTTMIHELNPVNSYTLMNAAPSKYWRFESFTQFINEDEIAVARVFRGAHGVVSVHNIRSGSVCSFNIAEEYITFAISPNHEYLAGGSATKVSCWVLQEGKLLWTIRRKFDLMKPYTKHHKTVLFSKDSANVIFADGNTARSLPTLAPPNSPVTILAENIPHFSQMFWGPYEKLAIVVDDLTVTFPSIKLLDLKIPTLKKTGDDAIFYPNEAKVIAYNSSAGTVRITDDKLTNEIRMLDFARKYGSIKIISANPKYVAALTHNEQVLSIYSTITMEVVYQGLFGHAKFYGFTPDFEKICIANDSRIIITGVTKGSGGYQIRLKVKPETIFFSQSARYMVTGDNYSICMLYDLKMNKNYRLIRAQPEHVWFSGGDAFMIIGATTSHTSITAMYNITNQRYLWGLEIKSRWAVTSPGANDIVILSRHDDPVLEWWNVSGQLLQRFHLMGISYSVSLCPSKKLILAMVKEMQFGYILATYENKEKWSTYSASNDGLMSEDDVQDIDANQGFDYVAYGVESYKLGQDLTGGTESTKNQKTLAKILSTGVSSALASLPPVTLHEYVKQGNYANAKELLDAGRIDVNGRETGREAWTPLHMAAEHGKLALAKLLLAHNANPNLHKEFAGGTPLICAAFWGHADIIRLLVTSGALPDEVCANGNSPFMYAIFNLQWKAAAVLCQYGIDAGIADGSNHTAWDYLREIDPSLVEHFHNIEIIPELRNKFIQERRHQHPLIHQYVYGSGQYRCDICGDVFRAEILSLQPVWL